MRLESMTIGHAVPFAIAIFIAFGASTETQQLPTFRTSTHIVPLFVSIEVAKGSSGTVLGPQDFTVLEDGVAVSVETIVPPPQRRRVRALSSTGPRMDRHRTAVKRAGDALVGNLREADALGFASFIRPGTPLLSDRDVALQALEGVLDERWIGHDMMETSWTGFNKARMDFANGSSSSVPPAFASWIQADSTGRLDSSTLSVPVMLTLSSGLDYALPGIKEVAQDFQARLEGKNDLIATDTVRDGIVVYGFGFEGTGNDKRLQKLASQSGGRFQEVTSKTDWSATMSSVVNELRNGYVIGFVPRQPDGKDHRIEVRGRGGLKVRTRAFYRAPSGAR